MKDYTQYTDEELLTMRENGEEEITEYLIEKYKPMVRQRVRVLYLVGGDQDDLIQEGMIGLFKAVRDYQPDKEASFQTFARLCIDRQMYNAIQNSNRQKHQPLNSYVSLSHEDEEGNFEDFHMENPESILIDQENAENLREEIKQCLSSMENRVLDCYLDGNSYQQIGELLGKSPKSVDNAMRRIRTKIKKFSC